jgi:hypothetical protein
MKLIKKLVSVIFIKSNDLRTVISNLYELSKLYIYSFKKVDKDKVMIVTIKDFNHGRYGFQLINYFSKAGYHIVFYNSNNFLLKTGGYDKLIFQLPSISLWRNENKLKNKALTWVQINAGTTKLSIVLSYNIIEIDLDYFTALKENEEAVLLPYYIHPIMNKYNLESDVIYKKNKIFFYGQADLFFDKYWIGNYFKKTSRKEIFDKILKSGIAYEMPDSYIDFLEKLDDLKYRNSFFFIDSKKVWIPADKWIELIGRFEFFIATPGLYMPLSHNVIEAMSQGTIPVLQYPEYFKPILQNGINCILFKNLDEFLSIINMCMNLSNDEVKLLSLNTRTYFKNYISPISFCKNLERFPIMKKNKIYMNAEEISLSKLKKIHEISF